jgi:hypothetical protein
MLVNENLIHRAVTGAIKSGLLKSPQTEHGPDLVPIPRTPNEVGAIIIQSKL